MMKEVKENDSNKETVWFILAAIIPILGFIGALVLGITGNKKAGTLFWFSLGSTILWLIFTTG